MKFLTLTASIILAIITLLIIMLNMTSKKTFSDREKSSPFECGFDPKSSTRLPFSIQFFLIAIIFLIFDVEITLLFPVIITLNHSNLALYSILIATFIMILIIGLAHEWKQGALNWTY